MSKKPKVKEVKYSYSEESTNAFLKDGWERVKYVVVNFGGTESIVAILERTV